MTASGLSITRVSPQENRTPSDMQKANRYNGLRIMNDSYVISITAAKFGRNIEKRQINSLTFA